jgi:hypothetical protein
MSKRVHGNNLLLVAPLRKRSDGCGRLGVGEVRLVCDVEVATCYGKSVID